MRVRRKAQKGRAERNPTQPNRTPRQKKKEKKKKASKEEQWHREEWWWCAKVRVSINGVLAHKKGAHLAGGVVQGHWLWGWGGPGGAEPAGHQQNPCRPRGGRGWACTHARAVSAERVRGSHS